MKPLTTLTLQHRDPLSGELTPIAVLTLETIGKGTLILASDAMGKLLLESCEVKPAEGFAEAINEATLTLKELHEQMVQTQIASQHALTDMFAIHKWLTG